MFADIEDVKKKKKSEKNKTKHCYHEKIWERNLGPRVLKSLSVSWTGSLRVKEPEVWSHWDSMEQRGWNRTALAQAIQADSVGAGYLSWRLALSKWSVECVSPGSSQSRVTQQSEDGTFCTATLCKWWITLPWASADRSGTFWYNTHCFLVRLSLGMPSHTLLI